MESFGSYGCENVYDGDQVEWGKGRNQDRGKEWLSADGDELPWIELTFEASVPVINAMRFADRDGKVDYGKNKMLALVFTTQTGSVVKRKVELKQPSAAPTDDWEYLYEFETVKDATKVKIRVKSVYSSGSESNNNGAEEIGFFSVTRTPSCLE